MESRELDGYSLQGVGNILTEVEVKTEEERATCKDFTAADKV